MKRIAIIPARGGSKRIPGKNIREFDGKPILGYAIDAAQASGLFEQVVVSTDSETIAEVAISLGAAVPFMRSGDTSDDYAPIAHAVAETLLVLEQQGSTYGQVCCLFATAPFLKAKWLVESCDLLSDGGFDSVVPVKHNPGSLLRSLRIDETGRLGMVWPEQHKTRSQDLEATYHDAGQFYWSTVTSLLARKRFYSDLAAPYLLGPLDCIDIDTESDWNTAEQLFRFHRTRIGD